MRQKCGQWLVALSNSTTIGASFEVVDVAFWNILFHGNWYMVSVYNSHFAEKGGVRSIPSTDVDW